MKRRGLAQKRLRLRAAGGPITSVIPRSFSVNKRSNETFRKTMTKRPKTSKALQSNRAKANLIAFIAPYQWVGGEAFAQCRKGTKKEEGATILFS